MKKGFRKAKEQIYFAFLLEVYYDKNNHKVQAGKWCELTSGGNQQAMQIGSHTGTNAG